MNLFPFLFSCVYSGVKLFVFAIKSRRDVIPFFLRFIYGLEEKNSKAQVTFRETLTADDITSAFVVILWGSAFFF